jgi:hypothetical protein
LFERRYEACRLRTDGLAEAELTLAVRDCRAPRWR